MDNRLDKDFRRYDVFKASVAALLTVATAGWAGASLSSKGVIHPAQASGSVWPFGAKPGAPLLQSPAPSAALKLGQNQFVGSGPPGSRVCVLGDGAEMGSVKIGESGKFDFEMLIGAPPPRAIRVEFLDWGMVRLAEPIALKPPPGPGPESDGNLRVARPIPNGIVSGTELNVAGTGKPGAKVRIQLDRFVLGYANVGQDGTWSFTRTVNSSAAKRELLVREIGGYSDTILSRTIKVIR
ncbi:MAG: hypothetical protein JSS71_12745 [Armatimonadetes bacterium]|nr:hypothetical protein [Armatimonadota bacterium]MBX3110174.1 hypothetical protein [Fimbriimonadaceae bacterium]